jgi:hypothetical protein
MATAVKRSEGKPATPKSMRVCVPATASMCQRVPQ